MSFIVIKKFEFKINSKILTKSVFKEWTEREGKLVLCDIYKCTKLRWMFGRERAKRTLHRAAAKALSSQAPFTQLLRQHLNYLPIIIRKIGLIIKRKGYKDLYSADSNKALLVIPRGIVLQDFTQYLLEELADSPQFREFTGLSHRVIKSVALEAEKVFFDHLIKGKNYPDPEGKGILIDADADYGWKLNGMNGHYYFAYYGKHDDGLAKKKVLNQFKSEMEEILNGQKIYLKRLESHQLFYIAEKFRGRK